MSHVSAVMRYLVVPESLMSVTTSSVTIEGVVSGSVGLLTTLFTSSRHDRKTQQATKIKNMSRNFSTGNRLLSHQSVCWCHVGNCGLSDFVLPEPHFVEVYSYCEIEIILRNQFVGIGRPVLVFKTDVYYSLCAWRWQAET